jgi:hypothetical protein
MAQIDTRNLSLMVFPQKWSATEIVANILLVPTGDPTVPVDTELPFAQAQPVLRAAFLPGFATPSWAAPPPASLVHAALFHLIPPGPEAPGLIQPPFKQDIFNGLLEQFTPAVPGRMASAGGVKKDLPLSYQVEAGFGTRDSAQFTTGDGYGCDLRSTKPNTVAVTRRKVAWGEIFSYAMRQPLVAQAIGMSYFDVHIPLDAATVAGGGWLWLEIDTTSPANWYAQLVNSSTAKPYYQQPVRSYAARIPALSSPQNLFGAVLFPVFPTIPTATSLVVDPAQYEADLYVGGFVQIVHAYQPVSADAIVGNDNSLVPGTDAGFQIGWDDEQVTMWLNRQVQAAQAMAGNNPADEFPLGVQGYRVDTREVVDGTTDPTSPTPPWNSLVTVNATVTAGDSFTATQIQESAIEPTPLSNGGSANFWLPRYFAHWRGRSLVVADKYGYAFGTGGPRTQYPQNPSAPQFSGSLTEILNIGLRYGKWYQFRARLSDLTGGGPTVDDDDAGAGVATIQFLRYVPPKAVGAKLDQPGAPTTILVSRPRLNYPEMVFAGAADDTDLDSFLAKVQAVTGTPPIPASSYPSVSMPDPDVVTLEIIVEAQAPKHDTGNPASMQDMSAPPQTGELDGTFRVVYRQQIPFTGDSVSLTIDPQAIPDIVLWTPPAPPTTLVVPTGRNLRIRLRGLGTGALNYWGSTVASTGLPTDLQIRYEVPAETGVIANAGDPAKLPLQLQAFYLREDPTASQQAVVATGINSALQNSNLGPGLQNALAQSFQSSEPTPIENLAQALNLPVNGLTLTAPPGQRILFGAQSTLRCSITQDGSSITFSSHKDLIGHWIVVIRLTIDRDWTWTGLAQNGAGQTGFLFSGAASMTNSAPAPVEIGRVQLPGVVSAISTEAPVDRERTELIFFATADSTVGPNDFPLVTNTAWSLSATFTGAPTTPVNLWESGSALQLPITLPPRQTPKLVSAGLAESAYVADANYASTEQRQRSLWLEFDSSPTDKNDEYFVRILAYGPDPLLVSFPSDLPTQIEPPLAIDPEWIRMIAAGDSNDDAGVAAMTQLGGATTPVNPSGRPIHYSVPLPDTISQTDLELFGFWTIELRVGHVLWSTAQARYGRALRVSGVQFPSPPLTVNVDRQPVPPLPAPAVPSIVAMANLAQTVNHGVSLTLAAHPQTEIWYLLYAQVRRVDGQAWRNILLARTPGHRIPTPARDITARSTGQQSLIPVYGVFAKTAVEALLKQLQLPLNTPVSVLAVELFNGEASVIPPPAEPQVVTQSIALEDPLGANLGTKRVLRVSPLTAVPAAC